MDDDKKFKGIPWQREGVLEPARDLFTAKDFDEQGKTTAIRIRREQDLFAYLQKDSDAAILSQMFPGRYGIPEVPYITKAYVSVKEGSRALYTGRISIDTANKLLERFPNWTQSDSENEKTYSNDALDVSFKNGITTFATRLREQESNEGPSRSVPKTFAERVQRVTERRANEQATEDQRQGWIGTVDGETYPVIGRIFLQDEKGVSTKARVCAER